MTRGEYFRWAQTLKAGQKVRLIADEDELFGEENLGEIVEVRETDPADLSQPIKIETPCGRVDWPIWGELEPVRLNLFYHQPKLP